MFRSYNIKKYFIFCWLKDINWKVVTALPGEQQLGLAGVFGGVSNSVLLVAGGSNFPNGMPWEGGEKKYWNTIYAIEKDSGRYTTRLLKDTLPEPLAYSASITTLHGIICIGGENKTGVSKNVFLMNWDAKKEAVVQQTLPSLPFAITNAALCSIGNNIFLVGGEDTMQTFSVFLKLTLNAGKLEWQNLPPLPVALSHTTVIAQSNGQEECVFVIGGRSKAVAGISNLHGVVYCYIPSKNCWVTCSELASNTSHAFLSAACGVAVDHDKIIVLGGDNGITFSKIEKLNFDILHAKDAAEKNKYNREKMELIDEHKGFDKSVWLYNTINHSWKRLSDMPYSPVTTMAIKWGNDILIPAGEIKPGTRTKSVLMGHIIY